MSLAKGAGAKLTDTHDMRQEVERGRGKVGASIWHISERFCREVRRDRHAIVCKPIDSYERILGQVARG